jgi:hypothetical protein
MLPRIGVLLLSTTLRTDKSIDMALGDHRGSLAEKYEDGHNLAKAN